jgi:hypothetical protein
VEFDKSASWLIRVLSQSRIEIDLDSFSRSARRGKIILRRQNDIAKARTERRDIGPDVKSEVSTLVLLNLATFSPPDDP